MNSLWTIYVALTSSTGLSKGKMRRADLLQSDNTLMLPGWSCPYAGSATSLFLAGIGSLPPFAPGGTGLSYAWRSSHCASSAASEDWTMALSHSLKIYHHCASGLGIRGLVLTAGQGERGRPPPPPCEVGQSRSHLGPSGKS